MANVKNDEPFTMDILFILYILVLCLSLLESKFVKSPPNKFFPPLSKFEPPYPIAPDCHLPNSAVLKELRKCPEDQEAVGRWKPPLLTGHQLDLIKKQKVSMIFLL